MTVDFSTHAPCGTWSARDSSLLTARLARRGRGELDHEWFAQQDNGLVRAVPFPIVSPRDQLDGRLTDTREIHSRLAYEEDDAAGAGFVVMSPDPVACDRLTSLAW